MVLVPGRGLDLKGKTLIGFMSRPSPDATCPPEEQGGQDMMSATCDSPPECGQPVEEPFDIKAAQRAASKYMAENPGHKIDVRESLPLCDGCQSVWDETAKEFFGPSGQIRIK